MVLEKTLESPLDCKEIQLVHPKGDQSWVFNGRTDAEAETPVPWPVSLKVSKVKYLFTYYRNFLLLFLFTACSNLVPIFL